VNALSRSALAVLAHRLLDAEEAGLRLLRPLVDGESFAAAVALLLACRGRVLVSGVGKSGIVGQRIAASFRSTGTPAFFLHPTEAMHGDLGLLDAADVALFLSKSGESEELLRLLPTVGRLEVPVVAVTARGASTLGHAARVSLDTGPIMESGPLAEVPTVSVTVFEVLGNLLVTAVYAARGIGAQDLAWLHPGGLIGRMVTLCVQDLMHAGIDLPCVRADASLREAIVEMMEKRLGMTTVVDESGRLCGVLTDGDLRRAMHRYARIDPLCVGEVMTSDPKTIERGALVASAVARMEGNPTGPITALVVLDENGRPEGVLHLHDCLRQRQRA
jgi:arabinose-5-phosphate isomerase